MDYIYIKNLEVYAFHGVNEEEKAMGQKFLISLKIFLDLREAGKEDNLNKTINYAEVCYNVEKLFTKSKHDLIEKCAEEIAEYILTNYEMAEQVEVKLKKPWAPIGKSVEHSSVNIKRKWNKAYIGLGSNLGEKQKNLYNALEKINTDLTKVTNISKFHITKPVGYTEQDDFLNCVAEIKTLLTPKELMKFLLSIEEQLKRVRDVRWGPRTIDLDVLLYNKEITSFDDIIIPHPRMHERLFVLEPLCEIAPYVIHPILNKRIIDIKNEV